MKKRMLAIFAMIALTFAVGVGSALAAQGEAGPPTDKCEASGGKAEGCENHPGDHDDDDDDDDDDTGNGDGGECDPLAAIDPAVAELCQTVVDALAGGELPAPPGGGGGEEPSCDQIPEPNLAGGCQTLVDTIGGGELPAPPGGGGEAPSCADLPPELAPLAEGCTALEDAIGGGLPV